MSVEIGGGNAIQPMMGAAHLGCRWSMPTRWDGLPGSPDDQLRDRDLKMYPLTLADVRENSVIVASAASWKWMERLSRKACVEVGSIASTCKAPRTGREVKDWGILHTQTQAIRLGRAVQAARRAHADPIAAILDTERGQLLFRGKVQDIARRTTEGFLRGTASLEGLDEDRGAAVQARLPERMGGRLVERRAARDDPRFNLRDRHGHRQCDRHRDAALRPARHRDRPAGATDPDVPQGARACRPARLRLRSRVPLGVA